jgi:SAM-dependent methyltransferase
MLSRQSKFPQAGIWFNLLIDLPRLQLEPVSALSHYLLSLDHSALLAKNLHNQVPPDWYESSVKVNLFQRFWHQRRIKEVGRFSERLSGKVLDIGSADGYFTRHLLDFTKASKIIGIDILENSVKYANKRYHHLRSLSFQKGDAHNLKFKTGEFSAVYMLEALEHVYDAQKVLLEIYRVLKPGGYTIILVPSENWLFRLGWPVWLHTRGKIWHDTHLNFFSGTKLSQLMKKCHFTNINTHTFILGMLLLVKARKPI